jgi:uncharacterized protein YutE (UPF0331/DUF86 family)
MQHKRINISLIKDKVNDIEESLTALTNYAKQDDEAFLTNKEAIRAARYSFIVLIEAATNIANHLCSRLLNKAPDTYAEAFLLLGEHRIIKMELAQRLAQMAKFRNLLVHGYAKVDDKKMLKSMREDLTDIKELLKEIGRIIMEQQVEKNDG